MIRQHNFDTFGVTKFTVFPVGQNLFKVSKITLEQHSGPMSLLCLLYILCAPHVHLLQFFSAQFAPPLTQQLHGGHHILLFTGQYCMYIFVVYGNSNFASMTGYTLEMRLLSIFNFSFLCCKFSYYSQVSETVLVPGTRLLVFVVFLYIVIKSI